MSHISLITLISLISLINLINLIVLRAPPVFLCQNFAFTALSAISENQRDMCRQIKKFEKNAPKILQIGKSVVTLQSQTGSGASPPAGEN